jgi:hypothetical protein
MKILFVVQQTPKIPINELRSIADELSRSIKELLPSYNYVNRYNLFKQRLIVQQRGFTQETPHDQTYLKRHP